MHENTQLAFWKIPENHYSETSEQKTTPAILAFKVAGDTPINAHHS